MEYLFAVRSCSELMAYQEYSAIIRSRFDPYLSFLRESYSVTDIPKAILLTGETAATQLLSTIPLPAYTNSFRTVFCPELDTWRKLYLRQLKVLDLPEVRHYYETSLTYNHILQILGHEYVHHSDLFIDEAYEKAQWFEEGMCEYISRRYFLTDEEFDEEARINSLLVREFEQLHGPQSLEQFSAGTYSSGIETIFFCYWKSFLSVHQIVERYHNDIMAVFREYHRWYAANTSTSLWDWLRK